MTILSLRNNGLQISEITCLGHSGLNLVTKEHSIARGKVDNLVARLFEQNGGNADKMMFPEIGRENFPKLNAGISNNGRIQKATSSRIVTDIRSFQSCLTVN
jgi:hypothetical protein